MASDRLIIAGGGLAGCLAALALAQRRPDMPFLLLEGGEGFGGNHIWSFFDGDVAPGLRRLVDPLIVRSWPSHEVRFPKRRRTLPTGYNSVTSKRLDDIVRKTLPAANFRLGAKIVSLGADHVLLENGERLEAGGVIDARGPVDFGALDVGWQKFVGREYRFERPHGLARPFIMDATVDQAEGYRFVYCLPFSDTEMLVEDTYYAASPTLDAGLLGDRIDAYVAGQGWGAGQVLREESGLLPIIMGGAVAALWNGAPVARLGLRGGFFHPTTGYSLPDAVRNADLLAGQRDFSSFALHRLFKSEAEQRWRERGFYRLLNRMLLRGASPVERYRVLEHFYRLDPGLIGRFYAGSIGLLDKAKILSGRPPVRVGRALVALLGRESASAS